MLYVLFEVLVDGFFDAMWVVFSLKYDDRYIVEFWEIYTGFFVPILKK